MKKLFLFVFIAGIAFTSCENKKQTEQISNLTKEQQRLLIDAQQKDSLINGFLQTLNEIEVNLSEVKTRENLISKEASNGTEMNKQARERIAEDITLITDLMQKNKEKIAALTAQLKNSGVKIGELEKMIKLTTEQLAQRDQEIVSLKEELGKLNVQVSNLSQEITQAKTENQQMQQRNTELNESINQKTNELNTAYFIIGESKDLVKRGILSKDGGFLGIGKSYNVATEVDLENFTKADIRTLKSIPLGVKNATVLSVHPATSYQLVKVDKKAEELVITDYAKFWEKSRLLVILIEK